MSLSKELLEELYNEQRLSMAEIAERLDCSPNKVAYW
ncbi:MAG: winged helix-turn-helix domain-containing protein, partial [Chloroflexi bacterium]|nr:winged helix-turn-helix domain-containing protein [Chloroflexota bacterium]